MKIQKLIPLLLAAACLTACAEIPPVRDTVPEEQQKTVAPPENGWTAEELMSVSYLDGIEMSSSLTLRDLGSAYFYSDFPEGTDERGKRIHHLEKELLLSSGVYFTVNEPGEKLTADSRIDYMQTYIFTVNGLSAEDSEAEIEKALGKPDRITDEDDKRLYYYTDRENGNDLLEITVNKSEELVKYAVFWFE